MSVVSKHYCEKEWESHDWESWRICFAVGRNAIGVCDLLESPSHIVQLEVGWGLNLMRLLVVWTPRLELSGLEFGKCLPDEHFYGDRTPNEANVSLFTRFHHVECGVDRLFLSNKHKHNFQSACLCTRCCGGPANWAQVLFKLGPRSSEQVNILNQLVFRLLKGRLQSLSKLRDLESGPHERVTNLLHSISDDCTILINNHVNSFFLTVLFELLEVS